MAGKWQPEIAQIEMQVYNLVKKERADLGIQTIQRVNLLDNIVMKHIIDMSNNNFFSHTSPNSGTFFQHLDNNISRIASAENIAWNTSGSAHDVM